MPRLLSASEEAALGTDVTAMAAHARSYVRLEIEDAAGVMQDMTLVLHGFTYRTDKDATVISGTVRLARWHTGFANSLSPLVTDALDAGRALKLYLTTLMHSEGTPLPGVLREVWDAEIDRVDAGSEYIELTVRDVIGATLADMEMTQRIIYESETGGREWGALIRDMLIEAKRQTNPAAGPGDPIVPTDFDDTGMVALEPIPDTPATQWPRLEIQPRKLLDIVRELANRIAWQLRPRWNEVASEFQLALYEPPHDKATVDWYIPKDRYIVIPTLARDRTDVINAARVHYMDNGIERTYPDNEFWDDSVATDAASVAAYGFRFAQFVEDESSPINSEEAAAAFVTLLFGDVAQPPVDCVVEVLMNFAVDLDDRITLEANGDHFETDQTFAVVDYEQDFGPDHERVRLTLRGKPTGGVEKWKRRVTVGIPAGPWLKVTGMKSTPLQKTFFFERRAAVIWVYMRTVEEGSGIAGIDWNAGDLVGFLSTETEYTVTRPGPTEETFVYFEPRGVDLSAVGEGAQYIVSGRSIAPELITPSHAEVAAVGTYGITVDDPTGIATALYYRTKSGPDAWSAWTLKSATPLHEAAYTEDVALIEGHPSFVEFRLDFTYDGATLAIHSLSAGMDFGVRAHVLGPRYEFRGTRLWIFAGVDSDAPTSGVQWIGRAVQSFLDPPAPTLASYQFAMEDESSRFGEVDTGIDFVNSGSPEVNAVGNAILRAIGIDGTEGPTVGLSLQMPGFVVTTPTVSIDTLTHTKEQGGTACTTDPAQSEIIYAVTAGGTDTVTIQRWVDGVFEGNVITASATHSDTIIDDHDFYEDAGDDPIANVVYLLQIKDSGGTLLHSEFSDSVAFNGIVAC